jgi:ferrochelatase
MHYGTPASMDQVEPYYTHIRRGRPPEPAALQDLIARYQAIGGPSKLAEISQRQADAIASGLIRRGIEVTTFVGAKHTSPFVSDAVQEMANVNVTQAVGIVLAPHYSSYSIAQYREYATSARDRFAPEMQIAILERWGTLPAFITALGDRVQTALKNLDPKETLVIFSAHSLPKRAIADGDPYEEELLHTSRLVADQLKLPHWTFAYQSASATGEPWLGPDILDVIGPKTKDHHLKNVIACTVGFVSDHLEVLYDLGIEARDKCAELGLNFHRADTINDDPAVMDALAGEAAKLFGF